MKALSESEIDSKITTILEFVNKLPLNSKKDRMLLAQKILDDEFTTDESMAYVESNEPDEPDEKKEDVCESEN